MMSETQRKGRGWKWWLKWSAIGFFGLLIFSLILQVLGITPTAEERQETETAVAIAEAQVVLETEMVLSLTPPTNTNTPTATATVTASPSLTVTPIATATMVPSNNTLFNEAAYADDIESVLSGIRGLEVILVNVVDGRDAGGDRSVMVGMITSDRDIEQQAGDIGSVLGGVYRAIRDYDLDLDSIVIIGANSSEITLFTMGVEIDDLLAHFEGSISLEELIARSQIVEF